MTARSISRSVTSPFSRGIVGRLIPLWTPSALFSAGQQGVFYVPQPVVDGQQVLFQDSAGTTPVTADGQPVGYIKDLSGNGNHATQATAAAKPLHPDLATDGTDDVITNQFNYGEITEGFTLSIVSKLNNLSADDDYIINLGNTTTSAPIFGISYSSARGISALARGSLADYAPNGAALDTNYHVITLMISSGTNHSLYIDGVLIDSTVLDVGSISVNRLGIGALTRSGFALYTNANTKGVVAVKSALTDSDRRAVENYLANLAGVTL